ncbi:MAG: hypothetical protein NEA02_01045 [Thermoanaerobaculia bacterium]|nr:hypothetical protein [Thermoanaerobaculia bacterium]
MKGRTVLLLSAVAFCLTEALVAAPRTFTPVVRAGDRLASAPVLIDQVFGPMDSKVREKVREKGRYVLELEGTGARGQVRVFFRRVDKQEANYRASHAVGDLTCSVNTILGPNDKPGALKGIVEPEDRPGALKGIIQPDDRPSALKGIIEPQDRPRTLNELGFRANAAASVQIMGPSILLQIRALDPPPPNGDGVTQCIMKVTLRAAK